MQTLHLFIPFGIYNKYDVIKKMHELEKKGYFE